MFFLQLFQIISCFSCTTSKEMQIPTPCGTKCRVTYENKRQPKRQQTTLSFPSFQTHFAQFWNFSMETEFSIIKDTEMQENSDYQPCGPDEVIEVLDSPPPVNLEGLNNTASEGLQKENSPPDSDVVYISSCSQDEPIDLTFDRGHSVENFENIPLSNPKRIIIQAKLPETTLTKPINGRGIKRNSDVLNSSNQEIVMTNWVQSPNSYVDRPSYVMPEVTQQDRQKPPTYAYAIMRAPQPQPELIAPLNTRQQEILKVAKSIFSKRTRTLYHWMYPTASKQQIKQVVSSTWDSMAAQEKNIYIAQVLGRFGYNNANLMVNPQLGQIKELPPVPGIQEFNPKASELQNAISSIANETENVEPCFPLEQPRKKARAPKKKATSNHSSNVSTICAEFDDDPELSQELAQFSILLKNQF